MLDDVELFLQLCQKHGVIAERDIIDAVKKSCTTGELRLGQTSIIAGLCEIISLIVSSSSTIKVLDLSDCMLLSKGLSSIFKALSEGSSVQLLYLKGNNISGQLVDQLGEVLRLNNTLKVINIEWNNLGAQVDSFTRFCEGLGRNYHLEEMDLRYNQISTLCADALAVALKTNKNLKSLDLSWNSLGMTGGQKILQGIKENRNLISLNLKGNCIPSEIHSAIKEQIMENQKRCIIAERSIILKEGIHYSTSNDEEVESTNTKSKHPKKKKRSEKCRTPLEEMRGTPLGNSGNDEDEVGNHKKFCNVSVTEKIQTLNQMLLDRAAAIDVLKAEIEVTNNELKYTENENKELKSEIQKLKEEIQKGAEEKAKELENLKKIHSKEEEKWGDFQKEIEQKNQNIFRSKQETEAKVRAYEKELRKSSLEMQSLKENFQTTVQNYEDTISECKTEIHRAKREAQEKETRYRIEINALKETLKETTEAFEKCQDQLQKLRNDLREAHENQTKLKIKTDEAERFAARAVKIEEALNKCKEDKDKLEVKLQDSRKTVAALQKQVIEIQEESIEPQKRYDSIKLELKIEKEKSENLKKDILEERNRSKEHNEQLQKMINQINGLYGQLSEAQKNHAETVREKNGEIEQLKGIIAQKTRELDEYKSEQVHRAHQFQAAVSKYMGTFSPSAAIS